MTSTLTLYNKIIIKKYWFCNNKLQLKLKTLYNHLEYSTMIQSLLLTDFNEIKNSIEKIENMIMKDEIWFEEFLQFNNIDWNNKYMKQEDYDILHNICNEFVKFEDIELVIKKKYVSKFI